MAVSKERNRRNGLRKKEGRLAGLYAATVMVPILIVLCPSFSGETGAYQATAVSIDGIVVRKWRKQNGVHNRNLFTGY